MISAEVLMTNWRPITLLHSSDTLGLYWLTIKMMTECWQWFNIVTPVRTQLRTVHGQDTQEMLNFYKAKKDPWKGSFRLKVNLRSISATSHCRTTTSLSPFFFSCMCRNTSKPQLKKDKWETKCLILFSHHCWKTWDHDSHKIHTPCLLFLP